MSKHVQAQSSQADPSEHLLRSATVCSAAGIAKCCVTSNHVMFDSCFLRQEQDIKKIIIPSSACMPSVLNGLLRHACAGTHVVPYAVFEDLQHETKYGDVLEHVQGHLTELANPLGGRSGKVLFHSLGAS